MDLGIAGETLGYIGGGAGIISTLKMIYSDWCSRQDRSASEKAMQELREKIEEQKNGVERRLDQQDQEIAAQAILVAREYVLKADMEKLKEHLDGQFSETRSLIFNALTSRPQSVA